MADEKRKIVIPGEIIASGEDFLPGEGTEKQGENIVAMRYGVLEELNSLVKVIPLSGVYNARVGNVIIGKVENITFNGWLVDVSSAASAFLPVSEYPKYIRSEDLEEFIGIGDMIAAQVLSVKRKSIDLTVKARGLGRLDEGIIVRINSNKVPRIIGKAGSMVNLIKDETNCIITVGQNGFIWIMGNKIVDELLAKEAILFVAENSTVNGLTERLQEWFKKEKTNKGK